MLDLIPAWAEHYDEFWKAIKNRNIWFIKLRYFAVILLILFIILGQLFLNFQLTIFQMQVFIAIAFLILAFNIVFDVINKKTDYHSTKLGCMQISIIMMTSDLFFLTILVYITGIYFSPLFLLYVFHMIIGSLILPGSLVYVYAVILSLTNTVLSFLGHYSFIPIFNIKGIYEHMHDHTIGFEILFSIVFSFVLITIVYLANNIAKELYQREQELKVSLDKLNEAEIAKQKYTLGIVHEIKSPIVAVKSILELILGKFISPLEPQLEEKIIRAKERSEEAIDLINDVLKFSKIKLLEVQLTEKINLIELINKIHDQHLEELKNKKINLIVRNINNSEKLIKGDKTLIELALSNLISNSVKFTNENGNIFIIIKENERTIDLEISDDGIGIPQNEIDKIFSQLYRASNAKKIGIEGSGMGLSIVKEIIEKHSGTINILSPSKIGNHLSPGTTVLITLPKYSI
ncbi:MAG: HAMP domain-containing histidine kinase [Melioribacteraceae bacterium]|nr:HAMP domain-containing histidine kinase [Melioribacteraceae bacterium]